VASSAAACSCYIGAPAHKASSGRRRNFRRVGIGAFAAPRVFSQAIWVTAAQKHCTHEYIPET